MSYIKEAIVFIITFVPIFFTIHLQQAIYAEKIFTHFYHICRFFLL